MVNNHVRYRKADWVNVQKVLYKLLQSKKIFPVRCWRQKLNPKGNYYSLIIRNYEDIMIDALNTDEFFVISEARCYEFIYG